MSNVCVIGGGTGQSIILRGLKNIENINLSAIVTVSDDGGSTGILRTEFNIPGMGDIRNVMIALASDDTVMPQVLNYRFDSLDSKSLGGHNLGNLILTALTKETGNFMEAVGSVSKILNVEGEIIPASLQSLTLMAKMEDGTIVRGESNIPKFSNRIDEIYYDSEVKATKEAVTAILSADVIVFGVGSIYTSIMPNIIIPEIKEALQKTKAKKVYYCNVMTEPGETDEYTVKDHVDALEKHMETKLDIVVMDNNVFPSNYIKNYLEKQSELVTHDQSLNTSFEVLKHDVVSVEDGLIRHDYKKIEKSFKKVLEMI